MEGLRRELADLRERSWDQQRRLARLEARGGAAHVETRECFFCHERGHVRRQCAALRAQRNNAGPEMRWKRSFHALTAVLPRQEDRRTTLSKAAILRQASHYIQELERENAKLKNCVAEPCDRSVGLSCGSQAGGSVSTCVDQDVRSEHGRPEEPQNTYGQGGGSVESSDEGVGFSCGDSDNVVEGPGMSTPSSRECHQPVGRRLVKQSSQPGTQAGTVVTRRRCLPRVPVRENSGGVSMSAEAVRCLLVRVVERDRGEDATGEAFVRENSRRDAGWHPGPLGLPHSVWAQGRHRVS